MDIIFNISEISIITGDNKFKTKRDFLLDFWKRNLKTDFEEYEKLTEFKKENDEEIIKKITSSNNINISSELQKCLLSKNTNDLNDIKKTILTKMDNLSENDKLELTKSITNITNTKFGIKNEHDIFKLYETLTKESIIKDNKYKKIPVYSINGNNIYIGGKIDGINTINHNIIEIKNRIHKLFYTLRDYEKVQIMSYMYLFDSLKGHLVEAHKKKDNTDINIIEVDYDPIYMNSILEKIIKFSIYFFDFINNHDLKIKILNNNIEINF
jgi:hypothetical protein